MAALATTRAGTARLTAEEFWDLHAGDKQVELVRGEVVAVPSSGMEHSAVAAQVLGALVAWNSRHHLGTVTGEGGGYLITRDPDTVRSPDAAYVSHARHPGPPSRRFCEVAPELVVEVVPPGDRQAQVLAKVTEWLAAGVTLVWLVAPQQRQVLAYRDTEVGPRVHDAADALTCEDVLPGFALPLTELFASAA